MCIYSRKRNGDGHECLTMVHGTHNIRFFHSALPVHVDCRSIQPFQNSSCKFRRILLLTPLCPCEGFPRLQDLFKPGQISQSNQLQIMTWQKLNHNFKVGAQGGCVTLHGHHSPQQAQNGAVGIAPIGIVVQSQMAHYMEQHRQ